MKIFFNAIKYFFTTAIVLLLILVIFLFMSTKLNPNEIPGIMGHKMLTVLSGSMRPAFDPGDVVIINEKKPSELTKGDVITFSREDVYVTHRIVDAKEENGSLSFVTKGDANQTNDQALVPESAIEGVLLFHIPYLGFILQEISGPYGLLLLVILPIAILMIAELLERRKKKSNKKDRYKPVDMDL